MEVLRNVRFVVLAGIVSAVCARNVMAEPTGGPELSEEDQALLEELAEDAEAAGAEVINAEVITIESSAPLEAEPVTYELSGEQLRSMPGSGNDALRSLQSLPGTSRVPFGGGGLVLRGSSPRDSSVYIDGIEVPVLFHFGALASVYPSALLDTVDMQPGGFGVEYGNARGGLVTATSRSGRADRWRAAGEVSLIDASVRADGPAFGGTWSFAVRRSYVDVILRAALPSDSSAQLTVAPRYYDGQVRYDISPTPRDDVSFFFFGSDDALALLFDDDDQFDDGDDDSSVEFGTGFARAGVRWERRADRALWKATSWVGTDRAEIMVGSQGQVRNAIPYGARASVARFFDGITVAGGIEIDGTRADLQLVNDPPPMAGVDDGAEVVIDEIRWSTNLGAWVEPEISLAKDQLVVRPGLRLDRYGLSDEWVVDPRVSVTQKLPAGLALRQSLGIYHQPPLVVDSSYGDADIAASSAVQAAIGIDAELPHNVDVSVTGYSEHSEGIPVDVVSGASPASAGGSPSSGGAGAASAELLYEQFGQWGYLDDVGRGRAYGIETLVRGSTDTLYGWISYTYSRSFRTGDPMRYPAEYRPYVLDQPHQLTALGSIELSANWRLGARVRYASGNPYTPVDGVYFDTDAQQYVPVDGAILSDRLPAFFQLDLRVDRQWRRSWGTTSLFLDVQNATNRVNPEGVRYSPDYSEIAYTRGLPVFVSLGVEYRP